MKKFIFVILLSTILFSCKKDEENEIPYVPVNIAVSITHHTSLNSVTGWAYVNGGSKGIVIYRYSQDEFYAMERHCPHQPANGNQVAVDSTFLSLYDAACGSKFGMPSGGHVENGPATRPLKRYNATYDGINTIHVYN